MKNILFLAIFLLCCHNILLCSACQKKQAAAQQSNPTSASQPEPIKLLGYTLHYVKLPFPYTPAEQQQGAKKTYTRAWLVRFELENMPTELSLQTDFFIGKYQIPEYGGWKKGIYFRIYDPADFEKLYGNEILIRSTFDKVPVSTKKNFQIGGTLDKLPIEDEDKLLERRQ